MPPEKNIVEFVKKPRMIDLVAGLPKTFPVPPTVLNVGVQGQTMVEVPVDGDPAMLVLLELVCVEAMEVDIVALDQEALQVLTVVGPPENQPLSEYWEREDFTWKIENWSQINRPEIFSKNFVIGGYKWRLQLTLSKDEYFADDLSPFLVVPDYAELPLGWSRVASFSLAVVNQSDPKLTVKKGAVHHFNPDFDSCGSVILSMVDLYERGPVGGFLVNDSLIIQAEVNVRKAADSKKETRFVGLKNQGATCYLNSLIQTLYHLPCFRKAVYRMPTSGNSLPSETIPLALQTLFYEIQCADTSPGTEDLTKSFGWDASRSFREEDVHEINMFLCEKLEKEMKGTPVDGTIKELFEGHLISFIECIDVAYTSTGPKESFSDLQLDVKGCKDVYESLDKYVAVEKLEGENRYRTQKFGLQNARKRFKFFDLPPVLQLQLKRFQVDYNQVGMMKINDRYEFPSQLDLDRENRKYFCPDADRRVRNLYTLYSVLVHSGASNSGGHYYAFIRPTLSEQWYKFNDDLVTKEERKTVFEEHFGGEVEGVQQDTVEFNPEFTNSPSKFIKHSNAYMLVYVRECDREKVMCSVDQEDVPDHLQVRLQEEEEPESDQEDVPDLLQVRLQEEDPERDQEGVHDRLQVRLQEEEEPERKTKNRNAHRDVLIRVSLDEDFENRQFVSFRLLDLPDDDCFRLELSKQHTYAEIVERVAEKMCVDDPNTIRLSCHNGEEQKLMALEIEYRYAGCLSDMLGRCKQKPSDDTILYFKVEDS